MTQDNYIKLGRILTLTGYFGLLAGLFAWQLVIDPPAKHLISLIILLQLGPLMFPLFGLLEGRVYTHAWAMYLAIFYFVIGVWYTGHDAQLQIGLYVILTSILFFSGCVLYARFMGKKLKAQSTSEEGP
jgi:uncharacterized membrane protein